MNRVKEFLVQEDAVSTVEIVLIVLVLVALVVLFKSQITTVVQNILNKVTKNTGSV